MKVECSNGQDSCLGGKCATKPIVGVCVCVSVYCFYGAAGKVEGRRG